MLRRLFLAVAGIVFGCSPLLAHVEEEPEVLTVSYDGVGSTTNCKLMYPKCWQVEMASGVTREKLSDDWNSEWLLNATLVRYGLHSHVELQMEVDQSMTADEKDKKYGVSLWAIGTKIKLNHSKGWLPEASIHAQLHLPGTEKSHFMSQKMGGMTNLLMHNDVCEWYDLDYVAGLHWEGGDRQPGCFMALCNNFPMNDRLTLMLQSQNLVHHGKWTNDLQLEASYLVHNNVMLDASTNWNLNALGKGFDVMFTVALLIGE